MFYFSKNIELFEIAAGAWAGGDQGANGQGRPAVLGEVAENALLAASSRRSANHGQGKEGEEAGGWNLLCSLFCVYVL